MYFIYSLDLLLMYFGVLFTVFYVLLLVTEYITEICSKYVVSFMNKYADRRSLFGDNASVDSLHCWL